MIDLSVLGEVQKDGSVILSNEKIKYREAMTGDYRRIRQTPEQRYQLANAGYQAVNSSVISAIGVFGNDLRIRFHNGSVYEYYGFANHFDRIMRANSKGQYFNRHIRPTNKYAKIGALNFIGGNASDLSDTEVFDKLDDEFLLNIVKALSGARLKVEEVKLGIIPYYKYTLDNIVFYRPKGKSLN